MVGEAAGVFLLLRSGGFPFFAISNALSDFLIRDLSVMAVLAPLMALGTANVFNRSLNKTFSRNDQPNIFVVGFNYQMPSWKRNSWTKQILGGWTLGGILR
jgi:hypothetical protein